MRDTYVDALALFRWRATGTRLDESMATDLVARCGSREELLAHLLLDLNILDGFPAARRALLMISSAVKRPTPVPSGPFFPSVGRPGLQEAESIHARLEQFKEDPSCLSVLAQLWALQGSNVEGSAYVK